MEPVYGILSTSSIAPRFIAGVRACGRGQLLCVSSRSPEKAREFAQAHGLPRAYGSHEALLEDKDVNTVYISNVNTAHYPWARAALLAGKHVVCEKPCTTCPEHTRELFRLAESRGLFFMEAQKMLFLPAVLRARDALAELGPVTQVALTHSFPGSYNGWMFDPAAGGGPLLSSGIYAVELLSWLFGDITELHLLADTLENGVHWQYVLTGRAGNGVLFTAKNSTRSVLDNTCRIFGQRGWLELPEYWKARQVRFHLEDRSWTEDFPCRHELMYEALHIAQCLDQGLLTSPVVTPRLSLAGITALCQAAAQK